jgi:hypothetical protein
LRQKRFEKVQEGERRALDGEEAYIKTWESKEGRGQEMIPPDGGLLCLL